MHTAAFGGGIYSLVPVVRHTLRSGGCNAHSTSGVLPVLSGHTRAVTVAAEPGTSTGPAAAAPPPPPPPGLLGRVRALASRWGSCVRLIHTGRARTPASHTVQTTGGSVRALGTGTSTSTSTSTRVLEAAKTMEALAVMRDLIKVCRLPVKTPPVKRPRQSVRATCEPARCRCC